jgi:multisubunit Na+/H+ antiporter MnhB subunit
MNHLTSALVVVVIIIGAVVATLLGWRYARIRDDSAEPRWRSLVTFVGLVLLTLSVLLFAAYGTRNVLFKGDRNGDWTTLIFIRIGNYLSLAGVCSGLAGKGKGRWPALIGACLMLFIWFSLGMSL